MTTRPAPKYVHMRFINRAALAAKVLYLLVVYLQVLMFQQRICILLSYDHGQDSYTIRIQYELQVRSRVPGRAGSYTHLIHTYWSNGWLAGWLVGYEKRPDDPSAGVMSGLFLA